MVKQQVILDLKAALELGEGQFIEFKELFDKSLSKEMVAFANASGGVIYLGITDKGKIKGFKTTNKLKSQIQDTAWNRLLVDLLARTDFMGKAGTGIKRVTDACNANGNKCTFNFSDLVL